MAKDILRAVAEQRAREAAIRERMANSDMTVVSSGFRKTYTDEEIAEIERLRAEMRERLTCPDDQYEDICRRHFGPDWKRK